MNYICTWLCADEKGKESIFPQTGELSSSAKHQNIYWRCVLLFYITSKRFNTKEKHLLFTNVKNLPLVDGKSVSNVLKDLDVTVIYTDFKYKTPSNYFGSFQNQFYEFSILEYISQNHQNIDDNYLILDSDCIFIKPVKPLFDAASQQGFISFKDPVKPDYVINGLSRNDLKTVYQELMQTEISEIPDYHLGEFLLCSVKNIQKIYQDFKGLWPVLLERNEKGLMKFNEEAHTLSYLYFKNGFRASTDASFMRRIWTNPVFYREVRPSDTELIIWHLPSEKIFGIDTLYNLFFNKSSNYGLNINNQDFIAIVQKAVSVPRLSLKMKLKYYLVSYYKALKKRFNKLPVVRKLLLKTA
ncbi:hypothetical protein [Mucilaginibacter arboris]|uniref:Uncharacterized protein n=1 Tax=Mucilaginibacter arboris TaxID=2682090 RepID=A0A7K1T1P6_9SPHI|nr:hypothetical protein [Mucilaginibacter arboris]MVN23448.1 hypothetical protein [Mucilaginibacter arboris]